MAERRKRVSNVIKGHKQAYRDGFVAKQWVASEIDEFMDLYGNSRQWALSMVAEFLREGSYIDDLSDEQVVGAQAECDRLNAEHEKASKA